MADRGAWGQYNMVADRLSRYHLSDLPGEKHVDHQCVSADLRLDPDGEDPPYGLTRALQTQESPESDPNLVPTWEEHQGQTTLGNGRLPESLSHMMMSTDGFLESMRAGYAEDPLFTKVIKNPGRFDQFQWQDGLLYLDRVGGYQPTEQSATRGMNAPINVSTSFIGGTPCPRMLLSSV